MTLLLVNAALLAAIFLIAWGACLAIRDVSPVDALWALGMVALAAFTFVQAEGPVERRLLLLLLCAAWGLRLGAHLLIRWRRQGPDRRYVALLGKAEARRGWSFPRASFLLVFAVQVPLLFIVALPVQLGQIDPAPPLGPLAVAGAVLAVFGIGYETIADAQLARFRRSAAPDAVMMSGLWRYSRHPNYFGDACAWWGLYLVAAETPTGLWALPGPLLLTWTLLKWSGVPTVEARQRRTRPGYEDYVRRTSAFVPMRPRG